MSTAGPKLEKFATLSLMSAAPTVMAAGTRAGLDVRASAASLPAATWMNVIRLILWGLRGETAYNDVNTLADGLDARNSCQRVR